MYKKGDKPGRGIYICKKCGLKLELENNFDVLTACSKCKFEVYNKLSISSVSHGMAFHK